MEKLIDLNTQTAAAMLRKGEITSMELTQASLNQIERLEPSIHAFITLTAEQALKQAAAADKRLEDARKNGGGPGLLHAGYPDRGEGCPLSERCPLHLRFAYS